MEGGDEASPIGAGRRVSTTWPVVGDGDDGMSLSSSRDAVQGDDAWALNLQAIWGGCGVL